MLGSAGAGERAGRGAEETGCHLEQRDDPVQRVGGPPGRHGLGGDGRHLPIPARFPRGKYLLVFDLLTDPPTSTWNITVGTIFRSCAARGPARKRRWRISCSPARAGLRGLRALRPSTLLVLTTGHGVNGFTLDRDMGEFIPTTQHAHRRGHPGPRSTRPTSVSGNGR